MKVYLVGGAVRNKLLNLPVKDRDWVVTGATPKIMLKLGYKKVGSSFPVFLHPVSHEEYALARIERKIGHGYLGFETCFDSSISLEEDLIRRDLTINAIALDNNGSYIDPCNGIKDINLKLLRHISIAFCDDPSRILRVARFAAYFSHLGFSVCHDTMKLMCDIVKNGELVYLSSHMVWKETEKALKTCSPQIFFKVLRECGALSILFPEINSLFKIKNNFYFKKTNSLGESILDILFISTYLTSEVDVRFAVLCNNFGILLNYKNYFFGYNRNYLLYCFILNMCKRLNLPLYIRNLILMTNKYCSMIHYINYLSSESINKLFDIIDVWRKPYILDKLCLICRLINFNYCGYFINDYPQGDYFKNMFFSLKRNICVKKIIKSGLNGNNIRNKFIRAKINFLNNWRKIS
ncbi:hypothetical protein ONB71_00045 [Candidatus Purcelliella pentastirinorum]|uniref:CCA-adding enzyme n=1 Tax=Candidatus Purcelliella pentastirinorum TaxID=472834 RepID=A0AAX3N7F2_9ENTR|nr:hypothetical protein [Candidatus Purcelliella pentastirinorum]WDI78537.1 hypothetical protein ONB71_00045 [Candidatus Purcelliella pentastirinorum]WDR80434.1 hypothetical protein ONB70_01875 [Candidatus Purcelliella pentastirinorum]